MLWNAPIWLNELLVWVITLLVWILIIAGIIFIIAMITSLINKIKAIFKPTASATKTNTKLILACLLVSCIGLILFYYPQPVIPRNYNFEYLVLEFENPHPAFDRITITDKKALNEFRSIIDGYVCRRSIMADGSASNYTHVVFISTLVRDGSNASPLHFIIRPGQMERYTAGNTDFIYTIEGNEDSLVRRVFDYAEKMIEAEK